jgi:hypothetical protein
MYNKTKPLETSLGQEVGDRTKKALGTVETLMEYPYGKTGPGTLSPENAVKVEEALGNANKMFEFFTKMKDDMSMHEDAVALHAINLKQNIETLQLLAYNGVLPKDLLARFPFLATAVKNALRLRGEEPLAPIASAPTTNTPEPV